jgi:VWFA-related protein
VAFVEVNVPDAGEPAEGWLRDVAADVATNQLDIQRIVVIVMDDAMTERNPGRAETAKQIARAVIDRLGPNDLAAVVFTVPGRSQDFTNDRRQLIAAAERFIPRSRGAGGLAPAGGVGDASAGRGSGLMLPEGPPLPCERRDDGTNCLTDALQTVAAALEDTPVGRKSIVLIGPQAWSASFSPPRSLEAYPVGAAAVLRQTLCSLQLGNVNVYHFDPTGLTTGGQAPLGLDALRQFAEITGGRATFETNAPWQQVPQIFIENSSYYLLGIEPAGGAEDGRFRPLSVRVRRSDVEVRTRSGYYAPEAIRRRSTKTITPLPGLDRAFGAALPSGTLPLDATVAPFARPDRKQAAVAITVGVRRPATHEGTVQKLDVLTAAFDSAFKERATDRQTVELAEAHDERPVELQSRLTLKPGRYEIRVAAVGPEGAGGVFAQVDIPDFSKAPLSVSGLVLGHPRDEASDVLADLVPVLPTARRVFSPANPVTAFLRVYQGGKDAPRPIQVHARILDAASRPVFDETRELGASLFKSARAADYRLELPLARLSAGEHLLTIEAMDRKVTLSRDVRFAVDRE